MDWTRRELFYRSKNLMLGVGFASLFPDLTLFNGRRKNGLHGEKPFFVLLRTDGGLDTTLGLDPKLKSELPAGTDDQDIFLEYRDDQIVRAGNLRLGPAAKPLQAWANSLCVVNGVQMRFDGGHEVDNIYMATGRGDSTAAAIPIELGMAYGTGPFGVVTDGRINLAGKAIGLSSTADLQNSSDQGAILDFIEQRIGQNLADANTPWEETQRQLLAGKSAAAAFDVLLKKLLVEAGKLESYHVAAAALASGGARQAQIASPVSVAQLDTHAGHEGVHLKGQTAVWQWVSDIFSAFKNIPYGGGTLFDATVFMTYSEFSRTPALNAARGKDHNPFTNSVLFAGGPIAGGTSVGASKVIPRNQTSTGMSDYIAWPFNYKTGKLADGRKDASFFFPENIIGTIGDYFGSADLFRAVPPETAHVPGIFKLIS